MNIRIGNCVGKRFDAHVNKGGQNIKIAFLEAMGQMKAWLKH
jgi:hypothetical protein